MKIVVKKQSIGVDYYVIADDGNCTDVFYSPIELKDEKAIESFVINCQKQRDDAEQAMRDYIPPEQLKIQELEAVIVEKEAVITAKTVYVADLTKQLIDARIEPVKEKPIEPIIKDLEVVR